MDLMTREEEERIREITSEYMHFLDDSSEERVYVHKIENMIQENGARLIINLNDLRRHTPTRAAALLKNFVVEIPCLQKAILECAGHIDADYVKGRDFVAGFEGSLGDRHVNPRTLKSDFLGSMVCCEGIVTKCSTVRPKVVRSVHFCPATKKTFERRYTDLTSYDAFPSSAVYPTEDENKNPLETEYGLSTYKDHQTFSIQELPESAPPGQLPRSIDIIADDDLADSCKPGDRVRVVGLYRCLPNKQNGYSSGSFRSVIIANNVQLLSKQLAPNFSSEDIKNIKSVSKYKNVLGLLAKSLAPSIWGHLEVKKAILCLLLGGNEKVLHNGSHIRGDINVLLVGDPSVAKSQLLRYVLHTAPRAIATTGRGSSGVGLTAAITTDMDSGERRLEAGAMVLADRGIVCIDEFDKMSDIDRTAIHEVMEQGRVTIAKAGIHAKLNARCSVLAAANPVFGRYNLYKTPMENIGLQDSLLSRFDLIFVLLDEHDSNRDTAIAEHVLNLHCYRTPGEAEGTVLPLGSFVETFSTFDEKDSTEDVTSKIYEKDKDWCAKKQSENFLTMEFVRKYIHMAKVLKPQLSAKAADFISDSYAELRSFDTTKSDRDRTMPVTVRQLETLIRLSSAMAKARLSMIVQRTDAEKAYELLHFACFKEKPKQRLLAKHKKAKGEPEGSDQEDEDDGEDQEEHDPNNDENQMDTSSGVQELKSKTKRKKRETTADITGREEDDVLSDDEDMDTDELEPSLKKARQIETPSISIDRYKTFRKYLRKAFDDLENPDDMVDLSVIRGSLQEQAGVLPFTENEFTAAFEQLSSENVAMIVDDKITLI